MGVKPQFPFRFITGLSKPAQQQLWRDFEYLATAIADTPFIVVDADGHGDFTTFTDAVKSIGAGEVKGIYVVSDAGDGTNSATVNGTITVLGPGCITTGPLTGSGKITFVGSNISVPSATAFLFEATLDATFIDCTVNLGAGVVLVYAGDSSNTATVHAFDTTISGIVYGDSSATPKGDFHDCTLSGTLFNASMSIGNFTWEGGSISTLVGTSALLLSFVSTSVVVRFERALISWPTAGHNVTWILNNSITNGEMLLFTGNTFRSTNGWYMAVTNVNNGAQVVFTNNLNDTDSQSCLQFTTTGTGKIVLGNNSFKHVVVTQTGHTDTVINVSGGVYRSIVTVSDAGLYQTTLDMDGVAGLTGLSLGGSYNLGMVSLNNGGSTSVGVHFGGNSNIAIATGGANAATDHTDSGTGNLFNTFSSSGTVLTGDFNHDFVAQPGPADAFRIRHRPVDATPPTYRQALVNDPATGKIVWGRTAEDFTHDFLTGVVGRTDASMLRHIPINGTKPLANQALLYDSATSTYKPKTVALTAIPFFVVASDGTGDYTSIKTAIDALPTAATANDISGIIYVKWSSTTYDDSTSTVDLSGKQVVLIGYSSPSSVGTMTDTGHLLMPKWTSGGFIGTSAGFLSAYGMQFSASTLTTSAFVTFNLEKCVLGTLTNQATLSNSYFRDCYFSATVSSNTTSAFTSVTFRDCDMEAGWVTSSATMTYNNRVRFEGCFIKAQATTTVSGQNGSNGETFEMVNCQFNVSATTTWTFNKTSTEANYTFAGCSRDGAQQGSLTIAFAGSGHGPQVVFDACNLPYTDLSFANSASDMGLSISGLYRRITVAQTAVTVSATLDLRGSNSVTALTLSSGAIGCVIDVSVVPGTATTGYSIAAGANNNLITIGNLAGLSATGTDSGSGNIINAVISGSTSTIVGTNDYRHEFELLGITGQDASKLRHRTISNSAPADRQELRWWASTNAWTPSNPDYTSTFLLSSL